jgi:molecular chaperone DnaK (HSP70)
LVQSRYIVGIDLGTTNSALFYVDTGEGEEAQLRHLPIPQVVQPGVVEERPVLPSFLYLPGEKEQPAGSLSLPWAPGRDFAVGTFARNFGSQVPTRLVSSAKSWLSNEAIDRRQAILPWKAPEDSRRVSPVEAGTLYLKHLGEVWNALIARDVPGHRLEQQDIILTVPASFDAVARELTVEAARAAGLENITLLEEPQAAFYAWIEGTRDQWRERVKVGDVVLVCDVGGGTSDFSLIAVTEEKGNLVLTRVAVGDHILLGGDNMDLTLANAAGQEFASRGIKLDSRQMLMLWHSCRAAKEQLFSDATAAKAPVTVLGKGSRLIGGTIQGELTREQVEQVLVDGFFPRCTLDTEPRRQRQVGLQELGLPYAADPAITKHLAYFLKRNAEALSQHRPTGKKAAREPMPTEVLFNGGVFKAGPLRQRLLDQLQEWSKTPARELQGTDLDLAVSRGAAYYGLVRRGRGVRIRGGTARTYYVGIESSLPAVPGAPPPLKALCVVPFGMEEGTETDVPRQEFGLVVGEPAEFRFLSSTVRKHDPVGALIEDFEDEIEESNPLTTQLDGSGKKGRMVPVHLHSKVTEIGTLELWCLSRDGKEKWKLEFNVRERPEEARGIGGE